MAQSLESGHITAAGVEIYWEARGSGGTPLVLVHGGYGTTRTFDDLAGGLARSRRVVAIELQGHGHTPDVEAPFSWEAFGDQVAGVITGLELGPADLLGYSLGGGASLRCAIQHPEVLRRLVLVSTPYSQDGWFAEVRAAFDHMSSAGLEFMKATPLYSAYTEIAPNPDGFATLMDKTGELQRTRYDWADEARGLGLPVLLANGDADSIPPAHAAAFFDLLGSGQRDAGWDRSAMTANRLAILPDTTHYDILAAAGLAPAIEAFLG